VVVVRTVGGKGEGVRGGGGEVNTSEWAWRVQHPDCRCGFGNKEVGCW